MLIHNAAKVYSFVRNMWKCELFPTFASTERRKAPKFSPQRWGPALVLLMMGLAQVAASDNCGAIDALMTDMKNTTKNSVQGIIFLSDVEHAIEKNTLCRTETSTCMTTTYPMEWARQGPDSLYFAFLLIAIFIVAITMKPLYGCAHPRESLMKAGRKSMRAWNSLFPYWDRIGIKDNSCLPFEIAYTQHARKTLSHYYRTIIGVIVTMTHTCMHPRDTMAKVCKRGAHAWRHHGKFIFILMLLTVPSSTATRLHERGNRGGGGRPVVLDEYSSSYLIDGKSAVEYGTRFTKTLAHHLEVHGVNAKHESRSGMYKLLDNVLDEMRSGASLDDGEGSQGKRHKLQAERKALDSSKVGSDDVPQNNVGGHWRQDSEEDAQGGALTLRTNYGRVISNAPNTPFEDCSRVDDLLSNLANATRVGGDIKEGLEFVAQVESYVEEFTSCQTPTSSCLAKAFRDPTVEKHGCDAGKDLREGMCEEVSALRGRVEEVIAKYPGLRVTDAVRGILGKIRDACKAVVPHGRRLAECPTIPTSGYYELTANCSLSSTITVPAGETLTIVGIGNPTIDRGEGGRHFVVNGHLKMTGVTLTKGYLDVSRMAHVNDCVEDRSERRLT